MGLSPGIITAQAGKQQPCWLLGLYKGLSARPTTQPPSCFLQVCLTSHSLTYPRISVLNAQSLSLQEFKCDSHLVMLRPFNAQSKALLFWQITFSDKTCQDLGSGTIMFVFYQRYKLFSQSVNMSVVFLIFAFLHETSER